MSLPAMIAIYKDSPTQRAANFTEGEFYTTRSGVNPIYLDERLIAIAQYVRDVAGVPIYITSTVRYPGDASYSSQSQHHYQRAKAIDLGAAKAKGEAQRVAQLFHETILTQGPHFQQLWRLGVRGFGLYDTFLHLDVRTDQTGKESYQGQPYALWDHRTDKRRYEKRVAEKGAEARAPSLDYLGSVRNHILVPLKDYEDQAKLFTRSARLKLGFLLLLTGVLLYGLFQFFRA